MYRYIFICQFIIPQFNVMNVISLPSIRDALSAKRRREIVAAKRCQAVYDNFAYDVKRKFESINK